MPLISASEWEEFLTQRPGAHLLQTSAWGELKREFGWEVARIFVSDYGGVGAQVLFRPLPVGFTLAYLSKGPVGVGAGFPPGGNPWSAWEGLWPEIDALCRQKRSVFLKVEPDLWEDEGSTASPPRADFLYSPHAIQPPRTILVDLHGDEQQILGRMKQKTRYNIRLALRKGVVVSTSSDLELFYRLMDITSKRDVFGVHSLDYYRRAYELFYPRGECALFVAEFEHQPLAAIMVFAHGSRAYYFYGASGNEHRERMPAYVLQWEAIRWARAHGCVEYDLWGVPDAEEAVLEDSFTTRADGLWGVYRFKRGFGGQLHRASGPWDRVYSPMLYRLYCWWVMRRAGDVG